jgi:hypothetical protein
MREKIRSTQDFWTGVAFVVFGVGTAILARKYQMGTTSRMGPGYFPSMLGIILACIGMFILVRSFLSAAGGQIDTIRLALLGRLLLSVLAFGLLLPWFGLFVAAFVTVMLAAWAGPEFNLGEGIVTAAVLSVSSWLVFVYALKQTMPVWPRPIADLVGL